MQRVLVTGGAGFIGSHTVDLLLEKGLEVMVLDNLTAGKLENLNLSHPNLEFIEGDVLEFPLIEELLKNCDAVLHLAAIVSVPQSMVEPIYTFQVNTQGSLHILEAVRKAKRPIRIVVASSSAVYGEAKSLPAREDQANQSALLSPYALQKWQAEEYACLYAKAFGISSLSLRYFNVYGERQDPSSPYSGVISRFLDRYHQDEALTVYGDGYQSRDFIHVSDVARANFLALSSQYHGVLNVCTGQSQTLLQLIKDIESAGHKSAKVQFDQPREGDIKMSYGEPEMAKQHLAFTSSVALTEGMKKMVHLSLV